MTDPDTPVLSYQRLLDITHARLSPNEQEEVLRFVLLYERRCRLHEASARHARKANENAKEHHNAQRKAMESIRLRYEYLVATVENAGRVVALHEKSHNLLKDVRKRLGLIIRYHGAAVVAEEARQFIREASLALAALMSPPLVEVKDS